MRYAALGFFMMLVLPGCGTSPEPDYYTLAAASGVVAPDISAAIKIERPILPGYLDRPDMVRQTGAYQVTIDDTRRWAAPLDEMFERILAGDLRQRMPNGLIITEKDEISSKTRFIIETEIENLNETDAGALLVAQLSIADYAACKVEDLQSIQFRADLTRADNTAALSELIGKLADRIVVEIREKNSVQFCATHNDGSGIKK